MKTLFMDVSTVFNWLWLSIKLVEIMVMVLILGSILRK